MFSIETFSELNLAFIAEKERKKKHSYSKSNIL
jgi:hypothetical protein